MPSLSFLDLNKFVKGLKPVTTDRIRTRSEEFSPQGLFSELIFGVQGSLQRKKTFSFINLNIDVIHPSAYKILVQSLDRKLEKFFSAEKSFRLEKDGTLVEDENGVTGISEFIKIFPKIKFRGETPEREALIEVLQREYKRNTLFIDKVPVIPPEQRPINTDRDGRDVISKLDELYQSIIRRSQQIKAFGAKGTMYDLLNWAMQKTICDTDTYVRTKIGKKYGLIRSSLLGKRVEFSGRAVITAGPDLAVDQIGVPLKLAITLFEPFIIHILLYTNQINKKELEEEIQKFLKLDLSTSSLAIIFRSIRSGDVIPQKIYDVIFEATKLASTGRVVIAKRDPVLHAESLRAFYPVIIEGNTLQISTLTVSGFNADFDGDAMAVFHPITDEAQEEVKKRMMLARSSSSSSSITFSLSREMCVGLYLLTKDVKTSKSPIHITKADLEKVADPYTPVVYKTHNTTMGKAIVNNCFPSDFRFVNENINKGIANKILFEVVVKYGDQIGMEVANRLKNIGFKYATLLAPSFNLDEITIPSKIYDLKKKLENASTEEAHKILTQMREILIAHLKNTGLYDLVEAGATKGWDQPFQLLAAKGLMVDPSGKILPVIKSSLADGLKSTEYFNAASGARAGIIDRVINTADTGYSSRKFAFFLNSVELDWLKKDCGTDLTLDLKLDSDLIKRLNGRYVVRKNKIELFNPSLFKDGELIHLRSPIFCKSLKICHTCYGELLKVHKSPYVGIVAAQNIGEVNTQTIMRTFHSTAIKVLKRDILKDIHDNDQVITIDKIKSKLYQENENIFCLDDCSIIIDLDTYKIGDNLLIDEDENTVKLNGLISRIEFSDLSFDFILDYPVILKYVDISKTDESVKLDCTKDSEILEVPLQKQDIKEGVLYTERLIAGRERFKDINHLFLKFYKFYKDITAMDLVHMEIFMSQILRDKNNPTIPARVGSDPLNPVLMNIKKNIFNSGFIQGLAFENVNQAIKTGLITKTELEPSILEKLLTGELVEKKKYGDK
jgi:DNA-directed RNA polymerase beta' subunit